MVTPRFLRQSLLITALGSLALAAQAQTVWRFSNWLPPRTMWSPK